MTRSKPFFGIIMLFLASTNAHALDSMTWTRNYGSSGDLGSETLQLLCVKQACHLSLVEDNRVPISLLLPRSEVNSLFSEGELAVAAENPRPMDPDAAIEFVFKSGKVRKTKDRLTPALFSIEERLRARFRS